MLDILQITEVRLAPVSCLEQDENTCDESSYCETLFVWKGLQKAINEYLSSVTLQDIIDHSSFANFDYVI